MATNTCDCTHLLAKHRLDKKKKMKCSKCRCKDYRHTPVGGQKKKNLNR